MRDGYHLLFGLLICALVLSTATTASAGAPQLVNYQGRLTDGAGSPVADGSYQIKFIIYDGPGAGSSAIWTEIQPAVTVTGGLFNVLLGSVTPLVDTVFNDTTRYLGITVGGDPELDPRTRIVTTPYSFRVSTVDGATGGIISGDVSIQSDLTVSGKATIGSGHTNTGSNAFVAGYNNDVTGNEATVTGGEGNHATAAKATVSGGVNNYATEIYATVSGGVGNLSSGVVSTVGGGLYDTASGTYATIAGGRLNVADTSYATVAGGGLNRATGSSAAIGGGYGNLAGGTRATVPGGGYNSAEGNNSFAAGYRAKAIHRGTFVWADSTNADFASSANDQFNVRASGGTRIFSNSGLTTGVTLAAGGGAWASVSDRDVKENIRPVSGAEILEKISQLDITRWNYITQDESIEHIGPMAQDFYELFGVGDNNTTITTIDPDGISLAAIKALYEENKELNDRLEKLEKMIHELSKK